MTYRDPKTGRWAVQLHRVFVYGTLMRGHGNHYLLEQARFVNEAATVDGFAMLYAGYPYVVRDPGDGWEIYPVKGEVYEVDIKQLMRLDSLEGYHPDRPKEFCHYVREEIKVLAHYPDTPEETPAFIYIGNMRYAKRAIDDPVLPNADGLLVYPGMHWEGRDRHGEADDREQVDDAEVVEPEDQSQGDVLGLHDEREQP
jgi:gamma-glutamylaminecyclotransferase